MKSLHLLRLEFLYRVKTEAQTEHWRTIPGEAANLPQQFDRKRRARRDSNY
jgi:hypothetical protein